MKHEDDSVDLPSEARRRKLSRDEEARLERLLEDSPEEKMLFHAGLAFDRDSSAREGDDVLVASLASRAAERFGTAPIPRRKRRRPVVTLLAAALVAAGTAAAGSGVVYFVEMRRSDPAPVVNAPPERPGAVKALPARGPERAAATEPPAPTVEPVPSVSTGSVTALAPPKRVGSDPLGASALFGEANKRRLAGDTAGAIRLYTELAERHSGSAEANLAELSLGKLFLASGSADRALTYFRRAGGSGGSLGSEALWGEAEALRALGRTGEERAALERLLAQFPNGAYSKAARKRLGTDAP